VLPDAYKLAITFKSCIANNMNTAVFQYYVKMTGYDSGSFDSPTSAGDPGGKSSDDWASRLETDPGVKKAVGAITNSFPNVLGGGSTTTPTTEGKFQESISR
jgi:hypothetical protein